MSIQNLKQLKQQQQKFSVIAAYDACFANQIGQTQTDAILVGDSLGMVTQGHSSTIPVSIEAMAYHTECVARGLSEITEKPMIISDMPFMTYHCIDAALHNATKLMQAGANMIKVEGGQWLEDIVRKLTEQGIPVCGHLGLTPQSVNKFGGYKVQAKSEAAQEKLLKDALCLEQAGADFIVLECIPCCAAKNITLSLQASTIGIGAGQDTDAQVLVAADILGLSNHAPRFVKNFLENTNSVEKAFIAFDQAVKSKQFPDIQHQYK